MVNVMKNRILWLLLVPFSAASFAFAQEKATPPDAPPFRETVEVRVMDLDVSVTDSRGRPVPDLKREDFTVRVDGKVVPIDYFTRIEEGTVHAPDLATASPEKVLAEYRSGSEAYVPRHFLIYVDLGHMALPARNRTVEALKDLVIRFGPSDSARVVMFDRRGKELTEWTASKETLLDALSRVKDSGMSMARLMTERQTLHDMDSIPVFRRSTREAIARSYADQERAAVRTLLSDLESELATLTPLPGKKIFLFATGGFELQPGYAMTAYALGGFGLPTQGDLSKELNTIVRRANASEITFYTIDARGLMAQGISASEDDPLAARPGIANQEDSQTGLRTLAQETGGVALVNSNDFEGGLARVYRDSSTYYSIGVNLSKLAATGYQNVRVDVSRPGVTARARRGFAPRSGVEVARDRTQAALMTNVAYNAFPVSLKTAPPTKAKRLYSLPLQVTFPASGLTFLPQEGKTARADAEFYIGVIDDAGRMSDIARGEASFDLPSESPPNAPITYTASLQTKKGSYRVVVNVRDKATGKMGTGKADVRVE